MTILFVSGVNDRSTIGVTLDEQGNLVHLMDGNASVHHRLLLKEGVAVSFLVFGKGVKQHSVKFKRPPSLIFNQIADPDTHRGANPRRGLFIPKHSKPGGYRWPDFLVKLTKVIIRLTGEV